VGYKITVGPQSGKKRHFPAEVEVEAVRTPLKFIMVLDMRRRDFRVSADGPDFDLYYAMPPAVFRTIERLVIEQAGLR